MQYATYFNTLHFILAQMGTAPDSSLGPSRPAWARFVRIAWAMGSACCLSLVASVTSQATMT